MWLILLPTLRDRDRVSKNAIVRPELKFLQRRTACEEVEHGTDNGLLVVGEGHAGRGLDLVEVLDVETGGECCWEGAVVSMVKGGQSKLEKVRKKEKGKRTYRRTTFRAFGGWLFL